MAVSRDAAAQGLHLDADVAERLSRFEADEAAPDRRLAEQIADEADGLAGHNAQRYALYGADGSPRRRTS